MTVINNLYRHSLTLLTDLYQLTMAFGYWKAGTANREAVFHLFFREPPFAGGYSIFCGLAYALEWLENFYFCDDDIAYLSSLKNNSGGPLFDEAFLAYLGEMRFGCDVSAVPEGTVVFPHEPLVRVTGPLVQCQLIETLLLNCINFQTLIATKASRICRAARGEPVLEFGLRRAQGIDGAVAASRAAYIGGCAATSNVLAGKLFGIPVRGTHAHSWVMSFDSELESFGAYADAMPDNCVFLVDTYDTVAGVQNAIEVGKRLKAAGHELLGIRLDSGDLAGLSRAARSMLDDAGFSKAAVVASNDLDEYMIHDLKQKGAPIGVWGVGTRLATAYDQPALGGVYKLAAIRDPGMEWQYKLKRSDQIEKATFPGIQQVRRYRNDREFIGDVIYNTTDALEDPCTFVDLKDRNSCKTVPGDAGYTDLLMPVLHGGRSVYTSPAAEVSRSYAAKQLQLLPGQVTQLASPLRYTVGLEKRLHELTEHLMHEPEKRVSVPRAGAAD